MRQSVREKTWKAEAPKIFKRIPCHWNLGISGNEKVRMKFCAGHFISQSESFKVLLRISSDPKFLPWVALFPSKTEKGKPGQSSNFDCIEIDVIEVISDQWLKVAPKKGAFLRPLENLNVRFLM